MSYDIKPLVGPQALYAPTGGSSTIVLTAGTTSDRRLLKLTGGTLTNPQTTSGSPYEVAGPKPNLAPIYLFGNATPILEGSMNSGVTTVDIKPNSNPIRPVLPMAYFSGYNAIVVDSAKAVKLRLGGSWVDKGTASITPGCGMRSGYDPNQILLGQKQAGEAHIVSLSQDLGESWSDMSTGLPDTEITSIAGFDGVSGGDAPVITSCPEIEVFNGRYWWKRYARYVWPEMWDYLSGGGCFNWRTEVSIPTPHLGLMITHWDVTNCAEHGVEDGLTFDLEIYLYSPKGASSNVQHHRIMHKMRGSKEDAEEPEYYGDINGGGAGATWQTYAHSVTKLSGDWTNGWFKIVFKPFGAAWEPDCLFRSTPWMAFNYSFRTGDVMNAKRAISDENYPACDEFSCGIDSAQVDSIVIGERAYPNDYLTLEAEFAARFPDYTLGAYMGYCSRSGTNPFYSHMWVGYDEGLGIGVDWYEYEMYDWGMGLIHIVGE